MYLVNSVPFLSTILLGMPSFALGILIYLNPIVAFTVAFFYFKEKQICTNYLPICLFAFAAFDRYF